ERFVVEGFRHRREHAEPRPVRRRAARLPATTPEHGEAARFRERRRRVREAGLADARLAGEEQQPPAPALDARERLLDLGELPRAPDEALLAGRTNGRQ